MVNQKRPKPGWLRINLPLGLVWMLASIPHADLAFAQSKDAAKPAKVDAPRAENVRANGVDPAAGERVPPEKEKAAAVPASKGILDLIHASGAIGYTIIVLSIAGLALFLENLMALRRSALLPHDLAQDLHAKITAGEFSQAEQACKARPSYLGYVVLAGLQEVPVGYQAVEKAMEDASQEQAARMFRRVEYLALVGNVAPMLGLLGTVWGLVLAFKKVAESTGPTTPGDLADGIYLALVTTVLGLVVAIPALSAYAILRSRVEQIGSEVSLLAEQVFINFKRNRMVRRRETSEAAR